MIEIKSTNFENNCQGCFDGKDQKDIKIKYKNGNCYNGVVISLCKKCREELIKKLNLSL